LQNLDVIMVAWSLPATVRQAARQSGGQDAGGVQVKVSK